MCGSRSFDDEDRVFIVLDNIHRRKSISLLIHGDSDRKNLIGADYFASEWAVSRGVLEARFPVTEAAWAVIGKKAGPLRNRMMTDLKPDVVVAFPGNRGTEDMKRHARSLHIKVIEIP